MREPFVKSLSKIDIEWAHGGSGRRQLILSRVDDISSKMSAMTKGYLAPQGIFDWHNHKDIDELFLVTKGKGIIKFENWTNFEFSKDDIIYIPANTNHMIENTGDIENEFFFIRINQ